MVKININARSSTTRARIGVLVISCARVVSATVSEVGAALVGVDAASVEVGGGVRGNFDPITRSLATADPLMGGDVITEDIHELAPFGSEEFWLYVGLTFLCTCMAATAAGLTMGLVSISPLEMQVLLETQESDCRTPQEVKELEREQRYAKKIMPLVTRHHLLLVTLLLFNAAANECLPLFLDEIVPTSIAILLSVTLVLVFGEIIPSAIFTGRNQLAISAFMAPVVWFLQLIALPIAFPLAKLLDLLLGEDHVERYNIAELKALVKLHRRDIPHPGSAGAGHTHVVSGLSPAEIAVVHGAMDLTHHTVKDILIHMSSVFMLDEEDRLDFELLVQILAKGHSRVPVYSQSRHNIVGVLMVKKLIVIDPADSRQVKSLGVRQPLYVHPSTSLMKLLELFEGGRSHMAVITDKPEVVKQSVSANVPIPADVHMSGICTFEDVIEALLNKSIADEFDLHGVRLDLKRAGMVMQRVSRLKKLAAMSRAKVSVARLSEASGSPIARARTTGSIGSTSENESGARSRGHSGYGSIDTTALLAEE